MGEFAAKFRPEVDLDEFERRLRAAAPAAQPRAEGGDPLAELARLVGGEATAGKEDPFEALFRARSAIADIRHPSEAPRVEPEPGREAFGHYSLREPYFEDRPHAGAPPQEARAYQGEPYANQPLPYQESEPAWSPEGQGQNGAGLGGEQQDWQGGYDGVAAPAAPAFRRKVMLGMGAVLTLGIVGIGGTLALRGKTANHEIVTIQADSDPAKVKPDQADSSAAPAGQNLFDRKNGGNVSKVVASSEQPADLGVTVKNARVVGAASGVATPQPPSPTGAAAPAPAQPEGIFPAPKKVKTVSVRADGSVIDGSDPHPAVSRTLPSMAVGAPPPDVAPSSRTPAAKSPERAVSTNEAALKAQPQAAKPQPAKPAVKEAAAEPAGAGGGFAVQLAGTPSEAEARAAATSLSSKYSSALQGRHPTFVQAKVGDKTIYRVRVGHLTEDAAKSMCSAIKGQGGNCFVAKN
jgi:hypothetical protein